MSGLPREPLPQQPLPRPSPQRAAQRISELKRFLYLRISGVSLWGRVLVGFTLTTEPFRASSCSCSNRPGSNAAGQWRQRERAQWLGNGGGSLQALRPQRGHHSLCRRCWKPGRQLSQPGYCPRSLDRRAPSARQEDRDGMETARGPAGQRVQSWATQGASGSGTERPFSLLAGPKRGPGAIPFVLKTPSETKQEPVSSLQRKPPPDTPAPHSPVMGMVSPPPGEL